MDEMIPKNNDDNMRDEKWCIDTILITRNIHCEWLDDQ